jgi:HEPN domain-containing protein
MDANDNEISLNRTTLQELAEKRLKEAKLLFDNEMYDGAYYLSGYAIEMALKACFTRTVNQYDYPDKKIVNALYDGHKLSKLLDVVSLTSAYNEEIRITPQLDVNWSTVVKWNESSRYQIHSKDKAENMLNAISDTNGGVFQWLKRHW